MTAYTQDTVSIGNKQQIEIAPALVKAARSSGKNPISIWFDYLKLKRGQGKLRFYEYMLYELYDKKRWSDEERFQFISAHIHWPISNACNDTSWWAVTEDKWLSSSFLNQHNLPVPKISAVFHHGPRSFPDAPKLETAEDLKSFFQAGPDFPLFAKPIRGMWSAGALRINGCTETHVQIEGQDPVAFTELAENIFGDQDYLIQECLVPHSFFDGLTNAIGTVRSLNLIGKDGLKVPFAALKLPMQNNIADNFWRPGNILCQLDPETGAVLTIVDKQNGTRITYDSLPNCKRKLIGEHLPMWSELKALNEKVALLHAENKYSSTDIAITEDGPVVVEVNTGCAFEIMQMATGKGLLTQEILAFFREAGAKI
ncbi:sugar-transfer associated ATP-grasp domain-containing protein [Celeribacter halophilus]|uniref:sugar-transfer associated ATP-grasp domain-containing protein n=1 Tax=Celeribacter halophilus TaxID=576117 RepID=UPI003A92D78A